MNFENSHAFAKQLDENDPLRHFRNEFIIPQHHHKNVIYFLGNSLGLQPKRTQNHIQEVLEQWGKFGVEGFFLRRKTLDGIPPAIASGFVANCRRISS